MISQSGMSLHRNQGAGGVEILTQLRLNMAAIILKLQGCQDWTAKFKLRMGVARSVSSRLQAKRCSILEPCEKTKQPHLIEVMVITSVLRHDIFEFVVIFDVGFILML